MRERIKRRPAAYILTAAGIAVLAALYIGWYARMRPSWPGAAAALASAALFGVFGVRLVFAWMEDWRHVRQEGAAPALKKPAAAEDLLGVFAVCLGACVGAILLVFLFQTAAGSRQHFRDAVHIWERLDSQHYLDIARDWYIGDGSVDRVVQLVFLPGYPLAIRLAHLVIRDWTTAAFAVSILCFGGAGVMLYRLAMLDTDRLGALRAVKYALILPGAFFFASPMSESLFYLLSISCLYAVRRHWWPAAGLLGGLAAFTRSLGLMLLVPAVYELITAMVGDKKSTPLLRRVWQGASLLLIPAGFGVYCLICRAVSGDAFKFLYYQREHWSQQAGLFFSTACYQTELALSRYRSGDIDVLMGLWAPNLLCAFGALGIMALAARRLRPAYSAYFMAYYLLAIGTTWLLSGPRYLAACAPLPLALAALTEDRRTDSAATVALTILYTLYAMCMANRWQVW